MDTFSLGIAFAAKEVDQHLGTIRLPTPTHEQNFLKGGTLHSDLQGTVRTPP